MLEIISILLYKIYINLPENDSISKIFALVIFYIPYSYLQYDHVVFLKPLNLGVEAGGKEKGWHLTTMPGEHGERPREGQPTFAEAP